MDVTTSQRHNQVNNKKDSINKQDLESLAKILSKKYVITPIIMLILFVMDHPNYEVSKFIHSLLKSIISP